METYTKRLFSEICKRGLVIETGKGFSVEHLPQCLVSTNNELTDFEFKITSIIPNGEYVHFIETLSYLSGKILGYRVNITLRSPGPPGRFFHSMLKFESIYFDPNEPLENSMKYLDFLTFYVYNYKNYHITSLDIQPWQNIIINTGKKNLKNKMIQDMIESYTPKIMYCCNDNSILSIIEIKIVIIDKLIKLDKWYDLEII